MTKEDIIAFREKHKITFTNERVELVLTNNQKLVGYFDTHEPNKNNSNQWLFTSLPDKKEQVLNGEDILNINFYHFTTPNIQNKHLLQHFLPTHLLVKEKNQFLLPFQPHQLST